MLTVHPALPDGIAMLKRRFPEGIDEAWVRKRQGWPFWTTVSTAARYICAVCIASAAYRLLAS